MQVRHGSYPLVKGAGIVNSGMDAADVAILFGHLVVSCPSTLAMHRVTAALLRGRKRGARAAAGGIAQGRSPASGTRLPVSHASSMALTVSGASCCTQCDTFGR